MRIHHLSKFFLAISILILISVPANVGASTTVTLGDPLGTNEIVMLYQVGPVNDEGNTVVTKIGEYNSSETFTLEDNQSYIIIRQPSPLSLADAPMQAMDMYTGLLPRVFVVGLFLVVFAGLIYVVLRMLRVVR